MSSPIFVKTEVLMMWVMAHTAKFPKGERFRLAKRIDDALFAFHENLLLATKTDNPAHYLHLADIELLKFRAYFRLALELQYTSPNQFQYLSKQVIEVGKLLGGWLKSIQA